MEKIISLATKYYFIPLIITIVLLLALLGYIIDISSHKKKATLKNSTEVEIESQQ